MIEICKTNGEDCFKITRMTSQNKSALFNTTRENLETVTTSKQQNKQEVYEKRATAAFVVILW